MLLQLDSVLDAAMLSAAQQLLQDPALYADGKATAAGAAKAVKHNLQAQDKGPVLGLRRKVEQALMAHDVFKLAARPKSIVRLTFNRYEPGMAYGAHVDEAIIAGQRTDLSFTLFLSDPESYQGGELRLDTPEGETEIKLAAGQAVLYPAHLLHQVLPVTEGERLAAIGWVRSYVRRPDQREILFDLDLSLRGQAHGDSRDRLMRAKSHLMRLWAED